MNSNRLKKIKAWIKVMLTTKTVDGWTGYFHVVYAALCIATFLKMREVVQTLFEREAIIENQIGTFSVNSKNDSFTKSLPSFEARFQNWISIPTERKMFVDVGANIGFYSVLGAKTYDHIVSIEPNPTTFARLQENLKLNNIDAQTFNVALAEHRGKATLQAILNHTGASTLLKTGKLADQVEVETYTLDEVVGQAIVNFLKIDVEGYEFFVLKGAKRTLLNMPEGSCIFIEISPQSSHAAATQELLESSGFVLSDNHAKNFLYTKLYQTQ